MEKITKMVPKFKPTLVQDGEVEEISYKCSDGKEFQNEGQAKEHERNVLREKAQEKFRQLLIPSKTGVYDLTYHYTDVYTSGWVNFKTKEEISLFSDTFRNAYPWAKFDNIEWIKLNTWLLFCYSSKTDYDGDDEYLAAFTSLDELKKQVEQIVNDFPDNKEVKPYDPSTEGDYNC